MPEIHLRHLLTALADQLINIKNEYSNVRKQEIQDIFIKTYWTKLAFNMEWLTKTLRTCLKEQALKNYCVIKYLILLKNPKHDRYQKGLASMVHTFFDKKSSGGAVKSKIISNQQLAKEIHKPVIRKFEKRNVHSSFIEFFRVLI